jgi:hypothetical protein
VEKGLCGDSRLGCPAERSEAQVSLPRIVLLAAFTAGRTFRLLNYCLAPKNKITGS